jgi:hypothetical protein
MGHLYASKVYENVNESKDKKKIPGIGKLE